MKYYVSPDLTVIAVTNYDILTESVLAYDSEGDGIFVDWSQIGKVERGE